MTEKTGLELKVGPVTLDLAHYSERDLMLVLVDNRGELPSHHGFSLEWLIERVGVPHTLPPEADDGTGG